MRAAVLEAQRAALELRELPEPEAGPGQIRLRVKACGVCRTDLHLRDGEIDAPRLPVVLGHQIVGISDDGRRLGVRGSDGPAASASSAAAGERTSAGSPASPAVTSTAGLPSSPWQTSVTASPSPMSSATSSWRRFCAEA